MIWKLGFWNEPELQKFWPGTMEEYLEKCIARTQPSVKLVRSGPDVPRAKMQQSAIVDDTFGLNMLKRRIIFTIPKKTNRCKPNRKKQ